MKLLFSLLCVFVSATVFSQVSALGDENYSVVRYDEKQHYPKYLKIKSGTVTAATFLMFMKQVKGMEFVEFRFLNKETDMLGYTHYRYLQVAGTMDVIGSMWIAHEKEGSIRSANGEVFDIPKQVGAVQTAEVALKKVLGMHKNTTYYYELPELNNPFTLSKPTPRLMVLPAALNEVTHIARIVYAIDLYAAEPMWRKVFYVDAITLQVLFTEDKIENSNVPGKANTKYSGVQDIITDSVQPGLFQLRESSRGSGNGIETLNMKKGTVYNTSLSFNDSDNYWNNFNVNFDEVAGDVHWGSEKTYDFFKNVFNRNSIDNNGFKLTSYVHYSTNYVNAFWNGYFMTYGDGGSGYLPLTSLDVCGHEITHGLTQKTAALVYSNESGALNESFSDIFGVSIDFYTRPAQANFSIGEQFGPGGKPLRDMKYPKLFANPDTYKGEFWIDDKSDNGGVHYNSGVQNKWFYLLCEGDTGTNDNGWKYQVDSIGFINAAQVAYRCLTSYLTPLSSYHDARFYGILSAKQIFGDCSNEAKQVANAWYAVGVGDSLKSGVNAAFNAANTVSCKVPFEVQFFNNSSNSDSYLWDFGDGKTSTLVNPVNIYTAVGTYTVKLLSFGCNGITKDSIIKTAYIRIDPNATICKLNVMPKKGMGEPLIACAGTLRDDGDTSNYGSLNYSVRSIIPPNTSVLKLSFQAFEFENQFDFLYVYDGPDTLAPLLGKYTGSNLPEGGIIYCRSGAATIRQTSDYLITGTGFELNWQCIPKPSNDCSLETANLNITGRKHTSTELTSNHYIQVVVRSRGTVQTSSTMLKYKLDNGSSGQLNANLISGFNLINVGPLNVSAPGNHTLMVWIEDITDGVKENDTLKIQIFQDENLPITMPFTEGFETLANEWWFSKSNGLSGMPRMDYENTSPQCRMRCFGGGGYVIAGTRSLSLDKSDRNWLFDTISQSNFVTLTYNMSEVAKLTSPLLLRFIYTQHGDRQFANDAIWLRGCDTCEWIKFFNLFANKAAAGTAFTTPIYNLNYYLDSAKQSLTSSFQLRIGQQDQNSSINAIQYAGYTFDNLRFSVWRTGINELEKNSGISIRPNPSNGIFTVMKSNNFSNLQIIDALGRMVFSEKLPDSEFFELNLSELAAGVYTALFTDLNNISYTEKLVIK